MRHAILTAVFAVAMTLPTAPRAAAADFDSAFAGESAFLSLAPGQSGTFTVFFLNAGAMSWSRGTTSQVDLAACLTDQVTCDSRDVSVAAFDPGTWLSSARYATHAQSAVAPGGVATFTYGVKVPVTQAAGRYRFNGDLVVSATGRRVHAEGYYQDVSIAAASCAPAIVAPTPTYTALQVGRQHTQQFSVTCGDGLTRAANVPVTVSVPSENVAGNATLTFNATTDSGGSGTVTWSRSNPSTETVKITPTGYPSVIGTATVRWIVPDVVISCSPTSSVTQTAGTSRVYTVTARAPSTGAAYAGPVALTVKSYIAPTTNSVTLNFISAVDRSAGTTITTVTTSSSGMADFTVSGSKGTIVPRVFIDENSSGSLNVTEFSADCGETTFVAPPAPTPTPSPSPTPY